MGCSKKRKFIKEIEAKKMLRIIFFLICFSFFPRWGWGKSPFQLVKEYSLGEISPQGKNSQPNLPSPPSINGTHDIQNLMEEMEKRMETLSSEFFKDDPFFGRNPFRGKGLNQDPFFDHFLNQSPFKNPFLNPGSKGKSIRAQPTTPTLSTREEEGNFLVVIELNGIPPENLSLSIQEGDLLVEGSKKSSHKSTSKDSGNSESYSSFSFQLRENLPQGIDTHFKKEKRGQQLILSFPKSGKRKSPSINKPERFDL